jgi:hypothetical protein
MISGPVATLNPPLFGGPADWISPGFDDELATAQPGEDPGRLEGIGLT